MSTLIQVPFHQDTLFLIDRDGEPYVPMRPIVEGIGLDWKSQYRKFVSDKIRWGVVILTTPSTGGDQETLCIPLRRVFGWLMTVSPNKVRPALREKIIAYQTECDDVLWNYWHRQRPALEQPALPLSPVQDMRTLGKLGRTTQKVRQLEELLDLYRAKCELLELKLAGAGSPLTGRATVQPRNNLH